MRSAASAMRPASSAARAARSLAPTCAAASSPVQRASFRMVSRYAAMRTTRSSIVSTIVPTAARAPSSLRAVAGASAAAWSFQARAPARTAGSGQRNAASSADDSSAATYGPTSARTLTRSSEPTTERFARSAKPEVGGSVLRRQPTAKTGARRKPRSSRRGTRAFIAVLPEERSPVVAHADRGDGSGDIEGGLGLRPQLARAGNHLDTELEPHPARVVEAAADLQGPPDAAVADPGLPPRDGLDPEREPDERIEVEVGGAAQDQTAADGEIVLAAGQPRPEEARLAHQAERRVQRRGQRGARREEVARRGLQGGDGAESPGLDGVDHRVGHQEAEFGPHAGIEHDRAAHRAEGVARDEACVHVVLPRGAYDQRP